VYETGRVQRTLVSLCSEPLVRQNAKLIVHGRHELIDRQLVTRTPALE
jgi:hypothetical protein